MTPALQRLPEIAADVQKTMANANRLILSLDTGYGDNTRFNRDLERLLVLSNDAIRSIRSLADLLARPPEALIKGRPAGGLE
jgi:paraquat-inducible protein B